MSARIGPAGRLGRLFVGARLTPLLVVGALGLGAFAVSSTPREEEPQIVVPVFDVFVDMPGIGPREVEQRLTIPLEKELWEIPGVEYVDATSRTGGAVVTVRFEVGDDQERALLRVYDKLAAARDRWPAGATDPIVKVRTIDDIPVLGVTFWSERHDDAALRRIAATVARQVSRRDGVSDVRVIGGLRRAVRIVLDPTALAARRIDPLRVAAALRADDVRLASASFPRGEREIRIEAGSLITSASDVGRLVVGVHDGRPVRLEDVARIVDGPEDPRALVRFVPGRGSGAGSDAIGAALPAVTVTIAKRKGADARRVVADVLETIDALEHTWLPEDVHRSVTRDYGATATEKANTLLEHLGLAILSVTVVLALSLGWRGAAVVFVSVPVTFALTLFVYWAFGYTLNRVTLFALIFVTGIVVDDSIIVVENVVRHLAMRDRPADDAVIDAVDEVGNPTILATLTVIAAVLPMAFVRGLMGPYMRPMPIGASLAMVFSLLVALVVAPWFSRRLIGAVCPPPGETAARGEPTRVERAYRWLVRPLLISPRRRAVVLGVVLVVLLVAVAGFPLRWIEVKMLPFDDKSEMQVIVDLPDGTNLETSMRLARELARALAQEPEVTDIEIYAGVAAPVNFNGLVRHYDLRRAPHRVDLQVNLVHRSVRREQSHDLARRFRPALTAIAERAGATLVVAEVPPGPPVLSTLVAEVYGPDHATRVDIARQVLDRFRRAPGVVDADWIVTDPHEKTVFEVDRERAALAGLDASSVARALQLVAGGERPNAVLHEGGEVEEVPVRLEFPDHILARPGQLEQVRLVGVGGALVPLSSIVERRIVDEHGVLTRKNLRPVVYVTADVAGAIESPVYAMLDLDEAIASIRSSGGRGVEIAFTTPPDHPDDIAVKWDGEWQITYEVFRDLGLAFAVVLLLIYLLIVGWFGRLRAPLVMMVAIPLSLIGIVPGHALFGAFFTATSMIGFIALAGIMVRNSVLLIDFVDLALARGRSLADAVIDAGAVRLRPIALTAGTVVVGAVVILFDPIFQGLAISLMFGALASTLLTLVVVPVLHYAVERRHHERAQAAGHAGED